MHETPLDRRTFVAGALAATTLAALPTLVRADDPAPTAKKRTLRKAVMFGMIGEGDTIADKFALLRDCGFQGVEMDSPSELKPEEVLKAMEKTGIKVHGLVDSVHWKFHLNNPEPEVRTKGREALETACRDAKTYGATSILLVPAVVNSKMSYDEAYSLSQEEIRKVLPLAKECNVRIAIENVWNNFLLSPIEAARYVDDFLPPIPADAKGKPPANQVAWHFDIGNVIHYGWPEQWVKVLGPRILKLHLKDYSRKKCNDQGLWKGFEVELGEGDAGWAATMKALDEVGYSTTTLADGGGNWATAEVGGGDRKRIKQVSEQMDRLFGM
jgi:hexulose-6-phosphate isomerase